MKFLFVSDFQGSVNSGAAGSLIAIGENLISLGHSVDFIWQKEDKIIKNANYNRFFELPVIQYNQIKEALSKTTYDVVMVSQPHCWYAFKKLRNKYPNTLFINRTHGWEKRIFEISEQFSQPAGLKSKITSRLVKKLINHCSKKTLKYSDAIIAASSSDADYIIKDGGIKAERVLMVPYGLNENYQALGLNDKPEPGKTRFLYTGQYLVRKGIKDIKNAFAVLNEKYKNQFHITFVVAPGSVEQVKSDFSFVDDNFTVYSWMDRKDLIEQYKNNDVFLMPSYGEGFGKTSLEAMAAGMCVVGYREGALADIGKDKVNCLLSEPGDEKGFLNAVEYCVSNKNEVRQYGVNAYNNVQGQTWALCAGQTVEQLKKLNRIN